MYNKEFCCVCGTRAEKKSSDLFFCGTCDKLCKDGKLCNGNGACYFKQDDSDYVGLDTDYIKIPCNFNCVLKPCERCHLVHMPEFLINSCECQLRPKKEKNDEPMRDDE